ncbi:MAG: diadenylate cyclase [Candidatus Binatia bacterium]
MGTITNLIKAISLSEIVDIILVAIVLYTGIVWAQRTRAAFVVRGIAVLGGIYLIARQLELQMIALMFQAFFAVILVIVVVVFQEELRQIFEQIALWSMGRKRRPALRSTAADVLVRTIADLAKDRIGALIVIRGNDPLERHITGGIALDGRLSEPLVKSIFEPHSPGHDGAVLIESNRITRFAAHLPLSKDIAQLANVGTRHAAGLGLAEISDALCIVVSEERGTVSVARDGRLRKLDNFQELGSEIQTFLHDKFPTNEPAKSPALWLHLLRENWPAKALALSLAIGFWYVLVPGSKTVQMSYSIPVSVANLSTDFKVEEVQPPAVSVTLTGPRRAFYLFDTKRVTVIIDASLADAGRRTFSISEQNVEHPAEVAVQDLSPSTVRLSLSKVPANDKAPTNETSGG